MTKSALADFSSLQRCYLRDIIKGNRNPTIAAIFAICEALQIHPVEFMRLVTERLEQSGKTKSG